MITSASTTSDVISAHEEARIERRPDLMHHERVLVSEILKTGTRWACVFDLHGAAIRHAVECGLLVSPFTTPRDAFGGPSFESLDELFHVCASSDLLHLEPNPRVWVEDAALWSKTAVVFSAPVGDSGHPLQLHAWNDQHDLVRDLELGESFSSMEYARVRSDWGAATEHHIVRGIPR